MCGRSANSTFPEMTDAARKPWVGTVDGLRLHPRFQVAMRAEARATVALYRSNHLLNSLMNDRARALFTHAALYLHYAGRPDGEPGLTAGAMKDLCIQLKLCSRGRCEAMLALLRAAGFLAAAPNSDRRRRLLVPTEKLFALQRERWTTHFEALCELDPAARHFGAALSDPRFVRGFVIAMVERYIAGLRLLDPAPELALFAERSSGLIILYSLALAGPAEGPFPPVLPVPLSINALAKTYSVSRKHVLTLLRDAEANGLLARANEWITILPRARVALERLFAMVFLLLAQSAEQSLHNNSKSVVPAAAPAGSAVRPSASA
jgi:hypothetical protein